MEELITVIVPVYNVKKYLAQCIESLIYQTYSNLEIILVDDCSDDGSADICDTYAIQDKRVRVIHRTEKGGEGGAKARNNGIEQANGSILYFIDSDDYIDSDMIFSMYQKMIEEQSDCVVSSFHYVDVEGEELPWRVPQLSKYTVMNGKEAAKQFLISLNVEGFSWNKLIRKEIIDKFEICFDETMNSFVDMYGMFRAVLYSSNISFYDAKPYYYRQHNVSCVHTMTKRKLDNFKRVLKQIVVLADENGMKKEAEFFYGYRMIMQLFDTIKARKSYADDTWRLIRQEYKWKIVFGMSLGNLIKLIFSYLQEAKMKMLVKILCVWVFFK